MNEWLECIGCQLRFEIEEVRYRCDCGNLLSVERDPVSIDVSIFDQRLGSRRTIDRSGVWRFREALLSIDENEIVSHPEGGTRIYEREGILFKHEGENPTASFKDRGMTVAVTQARRLGATAIACASTGNTSSSLAAYAAEAGMRGIVFVPAGKVATGKLAQTLAYGALCLQLRGDFDVAMELVTAACDKLDIYLVNSINPFRIEGQKTIVWELLQDLEWIPPDWIVVPAGNLGNTSAFGKALLEAYRAGWIPRIPRLASIQASGANPFYLGYQERFQQRHRVEAETVASAIRIGNPVSWDRAVTAIRETNGVVEQVSDEELMRAKSEIDRYGIGCEPASATTLAGVRKLRASGVIGSTETVACVLTGHLLKDPDAIMSQVPEDQMIEIDPTLEAVERIISR